MRKIAEEAKKSLSLQLLAEGGATGGNGAAAGPDGSAGTSGGPEGTGATVTGTESAGIASRQTKASFEELLKDPEYREEYNRRVADTVRGRLKNHQDAERRLETLGPVLEAVAGKYKLQKGENGRYDDAAMAQAVRQDDSWLQEEAYERGLPVQTLRRMKELENSLQESQQRNQVYQQQAERQEALRDLSNQAKALAGKFPGFNLEQELQDPEFQKDVFERGLSVEKAYTIRHLEEILSGGMQYAVQRTAEAASRTVQAGARRPTENGAGGAVAAETAIDPAKMTPEQRKDIKARVYRGEKVTF